MLSTCPFAGHAKEALDLARMQEQTTQIEYQTKMKVRNQIQLFLYYVCMVDCHRNGCMSKVVFQANVYM